VEIAIILAVMFGGAAFAFGSRWYSEEQQERRALAAAPRLSIGEVVDGEKVRIVGQTKALETVQAPFSGRTCVCWRVVVQDRSGNSRRVVVDEHDGLDFLVVDGTDRALVRVASAEVLLHKDRKYSSGFLKDPTPELKAFLDAHGIASEGAVFNKTLEFSEGVLEQGEIVAVLGVGSWQDDPDVAPSAGAGYRDTDAPLRLVMTSPEGGPLILTDEPYLII